MKFEKQAEKLHSKLIKEEVNGETRFYRKREVYPSLNEDGTINWFNTITGGKWSKLVWTLIFIAVILGFIFEYHANLETCSKVMSELNQKNSINISSLNLSLGLEIIPQTNEVNIENANG